MSIFTSHSLYYIRVIKLFLLYLILFILFLLCCRTFKGLSFSLYYIVVIILLLLYYFYYFVVITLLLLMTRRKHNEVRILILILRKYFSIHFQFLSLSLPIGLGGCTTPPPSSSPSVSSPRSSYRGFKGCIADIQQNNRHIHLVAADRNNTGAALKFCRQRGH